MKLYVTTYIDDEKEDAYAHCATWYRTLGEQNKHARELKLVGMRNIEKRELDFPAIKGDVVAWLNSHEVRP